MSSFVRCGTFSVGMTPRSGAPLRRQPIRGIGTSAARAVRSAIGYAHPTEVEIEIIAYMRGALVRVSPAKGARANLLRLDGRGIIGVAESLSFEERRWAVAHELGHFEAHADVSFLGLCSSTDMVPAYEASGREPEANAFAAELLMPDDLFAPKCDVAKVSWTPIRALAEEFAVSVTAAGLRFLEFTDERVAIVCAKDGVVVWTSGTKEFGPRPRREITGSGVDGGARLLPERRGRRKAANRLGERVDGARRRRRRDRRARVRHAAARDGDESALVEGVESAPRRRDAVIREVVPPRWTRPRADVQVSHRRPFSRA